jgi:hypothetical protein
MHEKPIDDPYWKHSNKAGCKYPPAIARLSTFGSFSDVISKSNPKPAECYNEQNYKNNLIDILLSRMCVGDYCEQRWG